MKRVINVLGAGLTGLLMLNGCGQPAPASLGLTEEECGTLEKKIIQTDMFIDKIGAMDPAFVEEYLAAVPHTNITTSTEKPRVLKDARVYRAALESKASAAGCDLSATQKGK